MKFCCVFAVAGLAGLLLFGSCTFADSSCVCNNVWDPVCGTDGKTYANWCLLNCAKANNPGLSIAHNGDCQSQGATNANSCVCPLLWNPVCGTNGQTYGNQCELNCAAAKNPGLSIAYQGKCGSATYQ